MLDCIVIGGGPAGLNASLVLARSGRNVLLFDEDKPRNAVTSESHGFITRDGIKPAEFKEMAHLDLKKYPNITIHNKRVMNIWNNDGQFLIETSDSEKYK